MAQSFYFVNQLDFLFKCSRDFVFLMRKNADDYEYVYTNQAAIDMLGGDVIGKTVRESTLPHLAKNILHYYDLTVEKWQQIEFQDYTYFTAEVRKYETTIIPITVEDEIYVLATTKEIAFDRDLQDKYLFMRSVFFKTFLSTVLISNDLDLIEANPRFTEDFNLSIDEVRGEKFLDLPIIDPTFKDQLHSYLVKAQNGENISSKIITFIDHSGKQRSFTGTFSPLTREDDVIAVFIILQEITDYLKQEEALQMTSHNLEMFKRAINTTADITFTDLRGRITEVNELFIERTGYTRQELLGQTHHIVNANYHPTEFFQDLWKTIERGEVWRGEIHNRKKNGKTYWVDTTIIPLLDQQGSVYQYLTFQFSVSEKKQMMIELRNIERTFRAITENTNDLIVVTDAQGKIVYASSSYIRKLGFPEQELIGESYTKLLCSDSIEKWEALFVNDWNTSVEMKIELKLKTISGEVLWTEGNYTITQDPSLHQISQIIMVSREITDRKELESKLRFMAYHDSLTKLPNRRYLRKEFPHYVENAKANFETLALFFIDGDNFKQVNDAFGHDVGDEFLKQFSIALINSVRSEDLVVRIGGDEFVIVMTGLSREPDQRQPQLEQIVERIRENLKAGWAIQGQVFSPTSSMGIAFYPDHSQNLEELIELADQALYEVKQTSKNNFKISGETIVFCD